MAPPIEPPPASVFDEYTTVENTEAFPKALAYLKDLLTNPEIKWESNGTKNDVDLFYYQPDPPLPAPIARGTGFFPAGLTAEQVLPIIHQPSIRKYWDERFESGFPLKRYSRKMVRFYSVQKGVGSGWFTVVSPRDFTGYSGHVKEVGDDGVTRYYYLQTSFDFDDVPEVDGNVRGQTALAGWTLEEKAGEPLKVSYIVRFDPKGSIPTQILTQVVKEAPQAIGRIRDYIGNNGLAPGVPIHEEFPGQLRQELITVVETERDPENGEILSESTHDLELSWFGAAGNINILFDEKKWTNGAKVEAVEGVIGEDLTFESTPGKVILSVKEAAKDKKLKIVLSKA